MRSIRSNIRFGAVAIFSVGMTLGCTDERSGEKACVDGGGGSSGVASSVSSGGMGGEKPPFDFPSCAYDSTILIGTLDDKPFEAMFVESSLELNQLLKDPPEVSIYVDGTTPLLLLATFPSRVFYPGTTVPLTGTLNLTNEQTSRELLPGSRLYYYNTIVGFELFLQGGHLVGCGIP